MDTSASDCAQLHKVLAAERPSGSCAMGQISDAGSPLTEVPIRKVTSFKENDIYAVARDNKASRGILRPRREVANLFFEASREGRTTVPPFTPLAPPKAFGGPVGPTGPHPEARGWDREGSPTTKLDRNSLPEHRAARASRPPLHRSWRDRRISGQHGRHGRTAHQLSSPYGTSRGAKFGNGFAPRISKKYRLDTPLTVTRESGVRQRRACKSQPR